MNARKRLEYYFPFNGIMCNKARFFLGKQIEDDENSETNWSVLTRFRVLALYTLLTRFTRVALESDNKQTSSNAPRYKDIKPKISSRKEQVKYQQERNS
jgi:hypothetical protein